MSTSEIVSFSSSSSSVMSGPKADPITRSYEFRAEPSPDGLTLEGYAAVFNTWADITDRLGEYKEQVAPGAFKRSIGQRTPVRRSVRTTTG
jgi:phage head maturation protease